MTPADFADLRKRMCKVHAELGAAILAMEDAEGLLDPAGLATMRDGGHVVAVAACTAMAHEQMQTAASSAEAAAGHLAELITEIDRHTQSLASGGVAPEFRPPPKDLKIAADSLRDVATPVREGEGGVRWKDL